MGSIFTKCDNCKQHMNADRPLFRVYHTGKFNNKYLCRECLLPKLQYINNSYNVEFLGDILKFPLLSDKSDKKLIDKTKRTSC